MDTNEEYGAPLSSLPPLAWLSGLNLGQTGGLSGDQQPMLGGGAEGATGPGMEGGLSLDALSELLQAQQGAGGEGVNPASMLQGIGGTVGQGTLAQGGPGYGIAGGGLTQPVQQQTGQGGYTAGQTQAGGIDPMAIIRQALGFAQKGIGLAGKLGQDAGPNQGYTAGETAGQPEYGAISPSGYSLTGVGAPPEGSPESLARFFSGELGGLSPFSDPTLQNLYTTGALNGLLGSANENAIQDLLGGAYGKFSLGGESPENIFAAPGGSAGFSLGGDTSLGGIGGGTDWLGTAGGGATGALGLLNLYQALQSGNVGQGVGGGLQTAGGLAQILGSSPALAQSLGLSGGALSGIGAGIGGLGGLLGLVQGIQSGNPMQIGSGALGALQGASTLSGALGGPTAASALASVAPEATAAALSALTGTTVAPTTAAISSSISAIAGAAALPVAAVVFFVTEVLNNMERERIMNAGFLNNPIKGALYSGATAGVGRANEIFEGLGSDLTSADTNSLLGALVEGTNSLLPYYATAQGGRGAIKASDTITGAGFDWSAKPWEGGQTPKEYTANAERTKSSIQATVNELLKRGMTYEQLGQLPVTGNWALQSLDMGGTPQEYLQWMRPELAAESAGLFGKLGLANYDPYRGAFGADTSWQGDYGPLGLQDPLGQQNMLLQQALGASMLGPADVTKASGLMTGMYGGPLWAALARMGAPEFAGPGGLIAQHFDPWVNARTMKPFAAPAPNPYALDAAGNPLNPAAWGTGTA